MARNDNKIQIRNSANDFLVFSKENGGDGVDMPVADENVRLTHKFICLLYETSKSTVSEHLTNIFISKELDENSTVRNFRTVASNGNLEMPSFEVMSHTARLADGISLVIREDILRKILFKNAAYSYFIRLYHRK